MCGSKRLVPLGLIFFQLILALSEVAWGKAVVLSERKLSSWERQGHDIILSTDGRERLLVRFLDAGVVRFWLEPTGSFSRDPSVSVLEQAPRSFDLRVEETPEALAVVSSRLRIQVQKQPLSLRVLTADGTREIFQPQASGAMVWDSESPALQWRQKLAEGEHVYGLGEDNDAFLGRMDRRGSVRDMWTGQEIRKGHVTADIPIPFLLSTGTGAGGYGILFDNSFRSRVDVGKTQSTELTFQAAQGELDMYFFYGPEFSNILEGLTRLTGRPSLPPLWALGFIQSKCTYWNWDEIDDVVQNLRTRNIPMDVMVIDYDWAEVPMNFKWAERWKGQSPQKLKEYGEKGTRFLISNAGPMLRKDASNYQDAKARGLLATDGQGNTVTAGHYGGDLMDFTAPGMKDWLWPQLQPLYDSGIDGWWLDLTEPEGEPLQTQYHGGSRDKIHNTFALLNTQAYYDMQKTYAPQSRPFILTRTGFTGIQRYGSAIWTGDIFSDYQTFMAHVPEALNTGLSGIPYWTNDSGGFLQGLYKDNEQDHGKLYQRWLQFSVFSPITRAHHVGPSAPYMFGPEVEEGSRRYLQLRYRLLPYIYSYAWQAHQTGAPLMRAMVYEFQDDPAVYNLRDQYLFGHELLVAPVVTEGTERRQVYLPKGRWIDRDLGHVYEGPRTACVAAPQDRIPVFARAGAIIPKAPLMAYTGQKPWDPLTIEIYPEGHSEFLLYQDDGETTAYEQQKLYTETKIVVESQPDASSIAVHVNESNKEFIPKAYQFEFHINTAPQRVIFDKQILESFRIPQQAPRSNVGYWRWDRAQGILFVQVTNTETKEHTLELSLGLEERVSPTSELSLEDCPLQPLPDEGSSPVQQIPQFFPPPQVPGTVQAENYDKGGEGIAYHDTNKGNMGSVYRDDDVDLIATDDLGGGYALSHLENGEWLEYTIVAPKSGYYELSLRVRNSTAGGRLHLERDGVAISTELDLNSTDGQWRDVRLPHVYLRTGEQIIRLAIDQGGWELNAFRFSFAASTPASSPYPSCQAFAKGYGESFSCWGAYICRKKDQDWGNNGDPSHWCVVNEVQP